MRLSALGGLAVTRMLPSMGSQRRLQVVDAAELTLDEAVFEMDEECAAAIRERSAYLRGRCVWRGSGYGDFGNSSESRDDCQYRDA